jgi:hypothetical protein
MEKSLKEEVNIRLEFLLAIIFLAGMSGVSFWYFHSNARPLTDLSIFEFFILVLAVFRLTRLFVYDGIMQYVRDLCLIKEQVTDPLTNKEKIICHTPTHHGHARRSKSTLRKPTVGLWQIIFSLFVSEW